MLEQDKKDIKIERKRYVVMRNNRTEIWAGGKHYRFRKLDDIEKVNIVSYHSEAKALASCSSYDREFEVVLIVETIKGDLNEK